MLQHNHVCITTWPFYPQFQFRFSGYSEPHHSGS
uniref:Uncharacterized protein n=1 Tax=Rhizophora mucronata TaxID=61149 RepID=A0A2P2PNZ7_RHIMU